MQENETLDWWKGDAQTTLRVDYPLTPDSLFLDVGAHTGEWTEIIYERYKCNCWLFEPIPQFMQACKDKFAGNPKIRLYQVALSDHYGKARISVEGIYSSLFKFYSAETEVPVIDAADMLEDDFTDPTRVRLVHPTLMTLNCEGAEFVILPRLIQTGLIKNIEHVQIQFHELYPDAEKKRQEIRERLLETHEQSYAYKWVWESWRRK